MAKDSKNRQFSDLANIYPLLNGAAAKRLVDDIRANGVRDPVIYVDAAGRILDGRNRYRAAREAGREKELRFPVYDGKDPLGFVLSCNTHRRQLGAGAQAMAAARVATLPKGANQHVGTPTPSQGEAAEIFGVSRELVNLARKVVKDCGDRVVDAVALDLLGVSTAVALCQYINKVEQEARFATGDDVATQVRDFLTKKRERETKRTDRKRPLYGASKSEPPPRGKKIIEELVKLAGSPERAAKWINPATGEAQ